jgi:hypothetical protein
MPARKAEPLATPIPPPAKTLEGRNDQLTSAAFDLAERRLHDGTASAQEVVHFLRQGSPAQRHLMEKLEAENELLRARVMDLENRTNRDDIYTKALAAFRGYSGQEAIDPEADYFDDSYVY